ncbi:MAG: ATP-binding protein, partial [Myxococcota bacterium]
IVGVFCAARSGEIIEANAAFLSPLGYTKADLPLDWRELTAPEFREVDRLRAESTDPRPLPRPFEKEFLARDGRHVPMLVSLAQASKDSALLIAVDLTERKQAEAERARHERELEETVALRTRELLESRERLLESERLAVVGTLAAGVAHQINNPIGAILNCSEYALMCSSDEDARDIFERALLDNLAEAQRCAQIVRSMLQFSRDQPTAKWVEDLNRVARRAQRAISAYAKDRNATISFRTADEALLARISPIELEQAIVNILRNAIESSPTGAQVSILLARRDKWATIEITDDGRGIPPENEERIFEPFFSTRTREGGTGLGLSVAHGVITDHGGQIRIDSIVGTGTRVVMMLPIEQAPPRSDFGAERGD